MRRVLHLIPLIIAIMLIAGCSLAIENELLQPVSRSQIEEIRAGKWVAEKLGQDILFMKNVEFALTEDQIQEIINWYNSIPHNRVTKIEEIQGSIKLGVVIEMYGRKQLHIMYTSEGDIFVTALWPGAGKTQMYKIEMPEMKPLFSQFLE